MKPSTITPAVIAQAEESTRVFIAAKRLTAENGSATAHAVAEATEIPESAVIGHLIRLQRTGWIRPADHGYYAA